MNVDYAIVNENIPYIARNTVVYGSVNMSLDVENWEKSTNTYM